MILIHGAGMQTVSDCSPEVQRQESFRKETLWSNQFGGRFVVAITKV